MDFVIGYSLKKEKTEPYERDEYQDQANETLSNSN